MQVPLEIREHAISLPEETKERIRLRAERLEKYFGRITGCRVIVEAPHRSQRKNAPYNVRIEISVPGKEIVVKRQPAVDVNAAIRDAFDAARRQLEDYTRKRRGQVKSHEPEPTGTVTRIFPKDGYGFLRSDDDREVYFHTNSVLQGKFDLLEVGTKVRFAEESGEKGPQASTVKIVGSS